METTPSKDIPGLREHLVALAAVHSRMMIEMNNIYELLRHHGMVLDLKFEEKNFPLGNSGALMTSLVKAEAKVETDQAKESDPAPTAVEEKVTAPAPVAVPTEVTDMPTEIPTQGPTPVAVKHNIVGHRLVEALRQHLNKDLLETGTGALALRHYSDDLTSLPMETLLKWPTGVYRHREDNAYQLLINTGKTEHGLVAVVVPRLYHLGAAVSDSSVDQAFIVWKRNTEEEVRVLNDDTPKEVLNALLGPMVNMLDVYLGTLGAK